MLGFELGLGAALPFPPTGRRALLAPALALTLVVALAVAVTEDGVRDALRIVGRRRAWGPMLARRSGAGA